MYKLDFEEVKEGAKYWQGKRRLERQQIAVYVMAGGGMLGRFAAQQPADFYIDDRVGRLPYPKKEIKQAVKVLEIFAEQNKLDPHNLEMPRLHSMGVF